MTGDDAMREKERPRKYSDADGYDNYMGGWSVALSQPFLDFVGLADGVQTIVDLGCGTGNLLAELARRRPEASLFGIDPSAALLGKARKRPELARAKLVAGSAERMPIATASADAVLSMLVLQEFPDRTLALSEMARVTRVGGLIAACQWDFARMPVIDALVEAISSVDRSTGARVSSSTPTAFTSLSELSGFWEQTGLADVRGARISVSRTFVSFDDLWLPLLAGSTPSTLALASLPLAQRELARDHMRARFRDSAADDLIEVTAEALVVSGRRAYRGSSLLA